MDIASLVWGIIFSSVGLAYFIYGKKQHSPVPMLSGLLLMGVPYFISNNYVLVAVSAALMAAPFVITL